MAITMDELIEKSMNRRSKVQYGHAPGIGCAGCHVGFVIWQERGAVWRIKWHGSGCSVTTGFAQHLCDMLDLSDVAEMIPKSLTHMPKVMQQRMGCVQSVLNSLSEAVNDSIK
jgi:hypothetical protein